MKYYYTYLIGWKQHNKWYYGLRWGAGVPPEQDLWISYFTSSKLVKTLRKEHGDPDVVEIRKTFNSAIVARDWELKVLQKLHKKTPFGLDSKWLNRCVFPTFITIGDHPNKGKTGRKHTEGTKKKISDSNKGKKRPCSEEKRLKLIQNHKGMTGRRHSQETKRKMSQNNAARRPEIQIKMKKAQRNRSKETRAKMREAQIGKPKSEQAKMNMSIAARRRHEQKRLETV